MTGAKPIEGGRLFVQPLDPSEADDWRPRVARWLETVEFALDNEPERIDALVELAESLETEWLRLCEAER